jgi:hypothetical protein
MTFFLTVNLGNVIYCIHPRRITLAGIILKASLFVSLWQCDGGILREITFRSSLRRCSQHLGGLHPPRVWGWFRLGLIHAGWLQTSCLETSFPFHANFLFLCTSIALRFSTEDSLAKYFDTDSRHSLDIMEMRLSVPQSLRGKEEINSSPFRWPLPIVAFLNLLP